MTVVMTVVCKYYSKQMLSNRREIVSLKLSFQTYWIKWRVQSVRWHPHFRRKSVRWWTCHTRHRRHTRRRHPWGCSFRAMRSIWSHGSEWRGQSVRYWSSGRHMHGHSVGWSWCRRSHCGVSMRRNERGRTWDWGHTMGTPWGTYWETRNMRLRKLESWRAANSSWQFLNLENKRIKTFLLSSDVFKVATSTH